MDILHLPGTTLLDGAMGTQLIRRGLTPGLFPEAVNLTDPAVVRAIHRDYLEAGSQIIYACTFGVNGRKARGYSVGETVAAALGNARAAVADSGREAAVGLDVGQLGELLEPYGDLTEAEARALYREVLEAGRGADLVALETYFDLPEAVLAVETAKAVLDKPVFVTMTFQAGGRTLTGCTPAEMAAALADAGADAIGLNCSLGPVEALPILRTLRDATDLPLIAKPNAGMPDPKTGGYSLGAADFAAQMAPVLALGVAYAGGCCGTDPDYIRELARIRV